MFPSVCLAGIVDGHNTAFFSFHVLFEVEFIAGWGHNGVDIFEEGVV